MAQTIFGPSASGSGSSSASGINYITNFDAETDTTGWATYADAAGVSPVDGTGGSPTETWTRSTSTPLRGLGSFLLTKDAANRQGEGASYAFTCDVADQAKVLSISFDYTVASGTYASGDLTVYIYDVTNAAVIQPGGYVINNITTGLPNKQICTFQTASNSTSYRLIIHTATTSSSAYTVKFDNVIVGPQILNYGFPISDWTTFTPTGSVATNATYSGRYRRVGDMAEVEILLAFTSTNTQGSVSFNMPSGLTIDTTKIMSTTGSQTLLGFCDCRDASASGAATVTGQVRYATSTSVDLFVLDDSAASDHYGVFINTNTGSPITIANGDSISAKFTVPVSGWSSTALMSNDTDTRVCAAVFNTAAGQTIEAAGAGEVVNFDTLVKDTHGAVTTGAAWKFTAPLPGLYKVSSMITYVSSAWTDGNFAEIQLRKNASVLRRLDYNEIIVTGTNTVTLHGTTLVECVAGDTLDVLTDHNRTTGDTTLLNDATFNYISIERLSGPSSIAASEDVNARYYASATSISGTLATIVWTTKDFDSHNAMSSGVYTVPIAGKYHVAAALAVAGTFILNNTSVIEIQKNSVAVSNLTRYAGGAITNDGIDVEDVISCVAGDTIRIQVSNSGTTPTIVSSNTRNFFSIFRVGN